jgi:uncharacterized protein GlcG (DUF336 family)
MATVSRAMTRGVDLETATKIVDTALRLARARNLRPMTMCVLDAGGDLVAFKRENGTGIRRQDVVIGKAYGALMMNRSSRGIGRIAEVAPSFITSLMAATDGKVIPTPGGVLIKDQTGLIIGAVGSSGDEADADEAVAVEAVKEAGLVPEPENVTG